MALRRAAAALLAALASAPAAAQSITAEADATAGTSTENVRVLATQARIFGGTASDWRFFAEATWAGSLGQESDAFAAAYPYEGGVRPMEVYGEKLFRPGGYLFGLRAGRYRTPFGLSSRGDHSYNGFVRAPLIRYGHRFALSNTWMEKGLDVIAGSPRLYVEASVGAPSDEGELRRRPGADASIRVQGFYKSLIVGASRIHTGRDRELGGFATGRTVFSGADARWTWRGAQVRGEWISGRPFTGVRTSGGYLDVLLHLRVFDFITPVARLERLDYDAGPFSLYLRRATTGARLRLPDCLTGQLNLIHQPSGLAAGRRNVFDASLTCTVRR